MEATGKTYNRWIPVLAGIAIQLCLGTAYIWGVFQPQLVAMEWAQTDAALAYSLLLGVLTFGSMVGGRMQDKLSPRPVLIIGGVVLAIGFFFAGFSTKEMPWLLWLTYGVAGGFGMGMTYTTTIAVCQKWFPDKRGLITGIIVSALGFGGLVFTPLANLLIASVGVMNTFKWFSLIFLAVTVIGGLIIKNPPQGFAPAGWTPPVKKAGAPHVQDLAPSQTLRTPQFWMIAFAMLLACAAGLMVIPFAKTLGLDQGMEPAIAGVGVMIITGFNSAGRLFWGWVSDRLGRKKTLILLMIIAAAAIPFAAIAPGYLVFVLIAVVGFSYGGFLGTFPALTADYFGIKNMGVNYGMVLMGFGVGAVASSYVAAYFKQLSGGFLVPFLIASGAAVVAAAITAFLKPPKKKEPVK
jgi:OFA family oxalate/formate antiporter-like MFS transporter